MEDDIQQKISLALEKGVPMSAIAEHLASHENPDYQAYGKSWLDSANAAPSLRTDYQTQATKPTTKTGLLDYLEQNPQEALGYGAGALALLQGPKIASKIADYRLKQRELGLKERSLNAYEAQVAKQGVTTAPPAVNPQDDLIEAVRQNEFEQQKATQPTAREMRDQIALQREQLKLEQDRLKHENFVRQNTWSPEEIALGRRIKDPAEMAIAQKIIAQKANQAGVAPTPQTPKVEPSDWLKQGMVNTGPVAPPPSSTTAPVEPTTAPAPAPAPAPKTPAVVEPATVVSTGTTPEAAAAPIEKAAEVKEVTQPTKAKTEPKIPKPEFFKNAPAAERYMYGTFTKYMDQPASAQAVVARAADYLPEGTQWQMKSPTEGGGLHPEQQSHFNRFASERLGIPLKEGKLPENFKWTTENRNQLAASVQSELEQHAKAGTLGKLGKGALAAAAVLGISSAVQAAQKGDFGPLKEAGFDIGLSAIPHPLVQAVSTGLTGTTLQPGTLPVAPYQSFERNVLGRKGVKEQLAKLTEGKTGAEYNAIRDQYLYSNPRAVSDYDRAVQQFQKQARQPVVPR